MILCVNYKNSLCLYLHARSCEYFENFISDFKLVPENNRILISCVIDIFT